LGRYELRILLLVKEKRKRYSHTALELGGLR